MQNSIKINCPAKINLTLEILNKREDGFHNIQSIMQSINLFDILTIKINSSENREIKLSGTSDEIPYDEKNLVYKAATLFCDKLRLNKNTISIHIEKNIPVSAGLAGGSTDAAGTLYGLNKLFNSPLNNQEIHTLCAKLGSDLNFCLEGGCQLTTGRGEILTKLPFHELDISLIKPKNLGISAKEAYNKYSLLKNKEKKDLTSKFIKNQNKPDFKIQDYLINNLELALIQDYDELIEIKSYYPNALMSGSGSTFFILANSIKNISTDYWIKTGLKAIEYGVLENL